MQDFNRNTYNINWIMAMDYGNMLLYYIPLFMTNRPQRVQNCAARLVARTCKGNTTTVLFQMHWICVCFRSLYKILFHAFKVLSGTASLYTPVKLLRSESCPHLMVPKFLQQRMERNLSDHQLPDCGISCEIILNLQQIKKYCVIFIKST